MKWLRPRVARWFILRPKIPIWVFSGGPSSRKFWYIFSRFGMFGPRKIWQPCYGLPTYMHTAHKGPWISMTWKRVITIWTAKKENDTFDVSDRDKSLNFSLYKSTKPVLWTRDASKWSKFMSEKKSFFAVVFDQSKSIYLTAIATTNLLAEISEDSLRNLWWLEIFPSSCCFFPKHMYLA
jgi:hypothetical protein